MLLDGPSLASITGYSLAAGMFPPSVDMSPVTSQSVLTCRTAIDLFIPCSFARCCQ